MKASRPAAMATGVVGGVTGETAGQFMNLSMALVLMLN
jgi:hypothetical protein